MKLNKITRGLIALALPAAIFTSCSENTMDEINKDKNHPLDVQAKFIMTELLTSTAFSTVGGDLSTYASVYIEHEVGVENQIYRAEIRNGEPISSTTYNNMWSSTYVNIKNAITIMEKCKAGASEDGNNVTLGVAKIMYAYNAAILTDLFGDVPFSQAGLSLPNGLPMFMQPKIDKQEEIYKAIQKHLDEAIVLLDKKDLNALGGLGGNDFYYKGNAAKWKQFAYGLKARYTMRTLNKATDKTKALNDVVDFASKSFASAADECRFAMYDGSAQVNPLCAYMWSRQGLGASQSLMAKMVARNDPRATQAFMDQDYVQVSDVADKNFAPNGTPIETISKYNMSISCFAASAPTMLLSFHEVKFLKAEALARLGRNTEAEVELRSAIAAAFVNLNISIDATVADQGLDFSGQLTPEAANDYYTASVKPLFDANPVKEVVAQKYIAFYGASGESVEAYSDYRRLAAEGQYAVELKNPENKNGMFPVRFGYGANDVTANPNVQTAYGDGKYVYTEKVWWAGGTR